jgi:hypothetical protein
MTIATLDHEPIIPQHLRDNPEQLSLIGHHHFSEFAFAQDLLLPHIFHRY